jgi:hypothetical protein
MTLPANIFTNELQIRPSMAHGIVPRYVRDDRNMTPDFDEQHASAVNAFDCLVGIQQSASIGCCVAAVADGPPRPDRRRGTSASSSAAD